MQTHTVEILITVKQNANNKLYEGEPKFTGEYVLRALAADGAMMHEARETVADLDVTTSDYARLLTFTVALERLRRKLHGGQVGYALRIVQSSKNLDGWLARGWKRNVPLVKELAGTVDMLLTPFPERSFIQLSRAELDERMANGKEVMLPA